MSAIQQAIAALGSSGPVTGQQAYTSTGTYSWTAPSGVTSVSVVCISPSGTSRAGGLAYLNNYSVTPGSSYTVVVNGSGTTYFNDSSTCKATNTATGQAGTAFFNGGTVIGSSSSTSPSAAGYSAHGVNSVNGTNGVPINGSAGTGGAGGSGASFYYDDGTYTTISQGGGGGTGIYGQGSNGAGGVVNISGSTYTATGGGGGSGGASGGNGPPASTSAGDQAGGGGGSYGGATSPTGLAINGLPQSSGAARIIWPGTTRQFPSTNTADM